MAASAEDVLAGIESLGTETKAQFAALRAENSALKAQVGDLEGKLSAEVKFREALETKVNMQKIEWPRDRIARATDADGPVPPQFVDPKSGKLIQTFPHQIKMAPHLYPREAADMPPNPIGRMLRGLALGGRCDDARELATERKDLGTIPDDRGGYVVGGVLAAQWIDLLRSAMALSQAGVTTVPMGSQDLTIAKLTKDPEATWHAENALLKDSTPNFGAVTLTSRSVVAIVKLSLELSQDAVNIEQQLSDKLTQALAHKIDRAGLIGETEDAAISPSGVYNIPGRSTVTSIGKPVCWDYVIDGIHKLLCANVPRTSIGGLIYHPDLWHKMAKLKTGLAGDNSPLPMPADVQRIQKIESTENPSDGSATKAVLGMWSDLLYGVRKQITVRLLDQSFMGSNLQLAVLCYARVAFAPARAASFVTLEDIDLT